MKVILHLGAHKTATSYIQRALHLSERQLGERKIIYIPTRVMRETITRNLSVDKESVRKEFDKLSGSGGERLILSDENIIGEIRSMLKSGVLYRGFEPKLSPIRDYFSDVDVYFCIRSYDEFLSSFYCESVRSIPFMSWQDFIWHFDLKRINWRPVITKLAKIFGENRIHIWEYSEFGKKHDDIFKSMLGQKIDLSIPSDKTRPSATGKAIKVMGYLQDILSQDELDRLIPAIIHAFPRSSGGKAGMSYEPFQPFSEQMAKRLRDRYVKDMLDIRTTLPGVDWL